MNPLAGDRGNGLLLVRRELRSRREEKNKKADTECHDLPQWATVEFTNHRVIASGMYALV